VKKIIIKMGGTIDVKSKLGEGSTFTLTMPYLYRISKENEKHPEKQDATKTDFTGKTIMVVEDHPLNLEIAMRFLEKKNATVVPAHNGKEAFDLFVSSRPGSYQAILMDVRMPILDGLAATRAIRSSSRPDAKTIPIIAMTANALDEDRKETKAAGMNDHVSKPFEIDTLYATLAKWMGMDRK
jgi:CheY-like chemotaxis protein